MWVMRAFVGVWCEGIWVCGCEAGCGVRVGECVMMGCERG